MGLRPEDTGEGRTVSDIEGRTVTDTAACRCVGGRLIGRIEIWYRRALSLLCSFLLHLKEGFQKCP